MSEQGKQTTKTGALLDRARFDRDMNTAIRQAAGRGQQAASNIDAAIRGATGRLPAAENQPAAAPATPGSTANAGAGTGMQPIRRQSFSEYMNELLRRSYGGTERGL